MYVCMYVHICFVAKSNLCCMKFKLGSFSLHGIIAVISNPTFLISVLPSQVTRGCVLLSCRPLCNI